MGLSPMYLLVTLVVLTVTPDDTPFITDSGQLGHHFARILLRHLKLGDGGQQVDMSHFLATTDIAVERLHQLTRIETVALT